MTRYLSLLFLYFGFANHQVLAGAYDEIGPFKVYESEIRVPMSSGKVIAGTFYLPARQVGAVELSKLSTVLVAPGFMAKYTRYAEYSKHLASHGFVVFGFSFPDLGFFKRARHDLDAKHVNTVLDFLLSENHPFSQLIDPDRLSFVGHSVGAKIGYFSAAMDAEKRVKKIVALDPVNIGGPPCFISRRQCIQHPVAPNPKIGAPGLLHRVHATSLILRASPDRVFSADSQFNAIHFWRGTKGPAFLADFGNVGHMSWVSEDWVKKLTKGLMTTWLLQDSEATIRNFQKFVETDVKKHLSLGNLRSIDQK